MRRGQRGKTTDNTKLILYLVGSVLGLIIIAFIITFIIYGNNAQDNAGTIDTQKLSELVPNNNNNNQTQEASNPIGKTVDESKNNIENTIKNTIKNSNTNTGKTSNSNVNKNVSKDTNTTKETDKTENTETKNSEKLEFIMPVEGEVIKKYAKEELVYSETLQEWIIHTGIDIKAEKTSVVKATQSGKVTAIKNDPRYGLTVTIEHSEGIKSIYANLLTAEFVSVGDEVTKGQTIGTVGDTATFEISDEPHLHFEILKDGEAVDPNLYVKNG